MNNLNNLGNKCNNGAIIFPYDISIDLFGVVNPLSKSTFFDLLVM